MTRVSETILALLRFKVDLATQRCQSVKGLVAHKVHVAAISTVSTARTSELDAILSAHRLATIAPISALHIDPRDIEEHPLLTDTLKYVSGGWLYDERNSLTR
jgi:hypothetical protein